VKSHVDTNNFPLTSKSKRILIQRNCGRVRCFNYCTEYRNILFWYRIFRMAAVEAWFINQNTEKYWGRINAQKMTGERLFSSIVSPLLRILGSWSFLFDRIQQNKCVQYIFMVRICFSVAYCVIVWLGIFFCCTRTILPAVLCAIHLQILGCQKVQGKRKKQNG